MTNTTCYIYRCFAKADMYLYLAEKDDFSKLPDKLKKNMGRTEFTMQLEINIDKKLAKEDAEQVIKNLQDQGFHVQMPSNISSTEILEKIALNEQKKFK